VGRRALVVTQFCEPLPSRFHLAPRWHPLPCRFWRYIRRRTQPKELCAGITFAMLGLGDTNYDKFW